jgi:hypothetical protein
VGRKSPKAISAEQALSGVAGPWNGGRRRRSEKGARVSSPSLPPASPTARHAFDDVPSRQDPFATLPSRAVREHGISVFEVKCVRSRLPSRCEFPQAFFEANHQFEGRPTSPPAGKLVSTWPITPSKI